MNFFLKYIKLKNMSKKWEMSGKDDKIHFLNQRITLTDFSSVVLCGPFIFFFHVLFMVLSSLFPPLLLFEI